MPEKIIFKTYEAEIKETAEGERALDVTITTADVDRDGDIVEPKGAKLANYRKNPVVLMAHDYKGLPIGKAKDLKKVDNGITAKVIFPEEGTYPLADTVYSMYKQKFMKAWSIGFIPIKTEDIAGDDEEDSKESIVGRRGRRIKSWELLEFSACSVPSNPNALSNMVDKGIDIDALKEAGFIEIEEEEKDESETLENEDLVKEVCPKCGADIADDDNDEYSSCSKCDWDDSDLEGETTDLVLIKDIVNKPEETDNTIRIPAKGEEGKHKGHKIRTITVSEKEGIKGIYCVDCKKIITYVFDKKKGWTMAKAKKWMADHGKAVSDYFLNVDWETFDESQLEEINWKEVKADIEIDEKVEVEVKYLDSEGHEVNIGDEENSKNEKDVTQFKERWNKSLPECFDVERSKEAPTTFEYNLFKQFLNCEVRNIFQNNYLIPSPLLGTYLAGFKIILNRFELKETRNFRYNGVELPPTYRVIQLNSKESDDFLIEGLQFYTADKKPVIVKFTPDWYGIVVSVITSNKHKDWNKELLKEAHGWAKENNYLKGEKFALNGEFLEKSEDDWENLITEFDIKDAIKKSTNSLENKGIKLESRGLLFIGSPGTGKTKTGRIILNKVNSTFIWVSSRDFDRAGTRALSLAFSLARDLAPAVLFVEDIDTWLGGYIVDLLKTELDGLKQNKGIVTILTSNYPEKLPDALLDRPGRFHHVLRFPLPNANFRKEMIGNWAGDIDEKILDKIIEKTKNLSGAHMKELVDFANIIADEEDIEIGEALLKSLDRLMAQRDLITEIRENKKSLEVNKLDNKEFELKAGAVLNAKNKGNLKKAQELNQEATALVQSVLDSAGTPEEENSIEIVETKEVEDDSKEFDLEIDTADDPAKDEEKDEDAFEVDEKVIAKAVDDTMNYYLGKAKK